MPLAIAAVLPTSQNLINAASIADVDARGLIQASQIPGEAAILVRHLGHMATCRITLPHPGIRFTRPPENNFIDKLAWDKLERLGIEPSPLCDDATFIRRVFLGHDWPAAGSR